jgi:hypothetical protein
MNSFNRKFPAVAQLKTVPVQQQIKRPVAPPVYRPQPTPKVLQCKQALRPFHPPVPVAQKWPGSQTIQRAATVVGPPDDKKPDQVQVLREQQKAAKKAAKAAARALQEAALAERKGFYARNAQQAHLYIQGRSTAQITEMKLSPKLFRTYEYKGEMGGEYMFPDIGHGLGALLAQSVIHVHWTINATNTAYDRNYGHFKNHTDKTKGGGSLGAIDAAKLTAMNVPAQESVIRVQELKEA